MLAAMSGWVRRHFEVALTRAIGGLLTVRLRPWVRSGRPDSHPSRLVGSSRSRLRMVSRQHRHDGVGGLRLMPPPPRESETPAHRVLRLGDAPESPIHSQNPDDWEDLVTTSGAVWLAPRGLRALGDRAYAAFHLRRTFRLVK